jgi:RHS repeat-associated protein
VQSYEFDELGRLEKASEEGAWSRTYGADQWGNSWVSAHSGVALASFTPAAASNFDANNRLEIQGSKYDYAGNQTKIGGYDFEYDGEGKVSKSTLNSVVTTNHYDGEGRRVKKVNGSRTVVYVYGVGGELIEEYDTVAPAEIGRQYLAQDVLGSTRAVFDGSGTAVRCLDYLPYGERIPQAVGSGRSGACWGSSEEPRVRFTGKERDGETGLDYFGARYYSGEQGRFTTADWSEKPEPIPYADLMNPQSLNLYAYVLNNPLNNRDLDGHVCIFGIGNTCSTNQTGAASQGAAISVGSQATQDAAVRLRYVQASLALKKIDPGHSPARSQLKIDARAASSPTGMTIAEIMAPISAEASRAGRPSVTNPTVNSAMEAAGKAGPALLVVGLGVSAYNVATADNAPKALAREGGAWAGALAVGSLVGQAGAGIGGFVGAFVGGVGAVPGAAVGGFIGAVGGGIYGGIHGGHLGEKLYAIFQ